MIYLVGGAPRVGKTKLVEEAVKLRPMHAISTDAIRYMLRRGVPKSVLAPELFWSHEEFIERQDYSAYLKHQNAESDSLWPYLVKVMESYTEDGYDLLVEGIAVLPSLIHKLDLPHCTVIIGNSSNEHAAFVAKNAFASNRDWLHRYSPEQITAYAHFFNQLSSWFEAEAKRYDMPYFNISDDLFTADIKKVAQALAG